MNFFDFFPPSQWAWREAGMVLPVMVCVVVPMLVRMARAQDRAAQPRPISYAWHELPGNRK